jgi:hypothetical protein
LPLLWAPDWRSTRVLLEPEGRDMKTRDENNRRSTPLAGRARPITQWSSASGLERRKGSTAAPPAARSAAQYRVVKNTSRSVRPRVRRWPAYATTSMARRRWPIRTRIRSTSPRCHQVCEGECTVHLQGGRRRGRVITVKDIHALASLPSKEELISKSCSSRRHRRSAWR